MGTSASEEKGEYNSYENRESFLPRCNVIGFVENNKSTELYFVVAAIGLTKVLRCYLLPLSSHVSARPRDSRDSLFTTLQWLTVGAVGRLAN